MILAPLLWTLAGCGGDDLRLRLSRGVSTVVIAEWRDHGEEAWVEWGTDSSYGRVAPAWESGQAALVGVPERTTVHARLAREADGEVTYSDDVSIETGALPAFLEELAVREDSGAPFGEFFVMSLNLLGASSGILGSTQTVIFDRAGRVVWYTGPEAGFVPAARPSRDGRAIVYLWREAVSSGAEARVCRAELSGERITCVETPKATHDFHELPDGSFVYGAEDVREWEGLTLAGNALVHQAPDGRTETWWSTWDEIEPVYQEEWADVQAGAQVDWTHFNGLWYDPVEAAWYLSFLQLEEIRKVSEATGRTEWVLGGAESDFAMKGDSFGPQHAPQLVEGGLLLFDNNTTDAPSGLSAWRLDEAGRVATQSLWFPHPEGRHNVVLGDANLLPNGSYAATFGDVGEAYVFSPEGEVEWAMGLDAGTIPGQVYVYDDLYAMAAD